jgi:hypothetical protein
LWPKKKFFLMNSKTLASRIQGCQSFLDAIFQNGWKFLYTQLPLNYQMNIKYTKCPWEIPNGHRIYVQTFSIARNYKIYPNWDFGLKYTIWQPCSNHYSTRAIRGHPGSNPAIVSYNASALKIDNPATSLVQISSSTLKKRSM